MNQSEGTQCAPKIEIVTQNDNLGRLLRRGDEIINSQTVNGELKPIETWPRNLRREFMRLAAKVDGK